MSRHLFVAGLVLVSGSASAFAAIGADNCADAPVVGPGLHTWDNTAATPDGQQPCAEANGGDLSSADIWFKLVAPAAGAYRAFTCGGTDVDTAITVYDACGGSIIACNDDACDFQSSVLINLAANQTVLIRVGGWDALERGAGTLTISDPISNVYIEGATDAGELPATAAVPSGSGQTLSAIAGEIAVANADMFKIRICEPGNFSASNVNSSAFDSQLWLFDADGRGVAFNDDADDTVAVGESALNNSLVTAPGIYYLAISGYNRDASNASGLLFTNEPFTGTRAPNGPGAALPLTTWTGTNTFNTGSYLISLTGVCYVDSAPACIADVDDGSGTGTSDGGVTIEDLLFYLVIFGDGAVRADVDNGTGTGTPDGGVTIEDLLYFLLRFSNGC